MVHVSRANFNHQPHDNLTSLNIVYSPIQNLHKVISGHHFVPKLKKGYCFSSCS